MGGEALRRAGRLTALVVGNGEPPSAALFEELMAARPTLLLCADGGADTVRRYGREPDYVVGDLDSVCPATVRELPGHRTVRIDADDTSTDLAKVLRHAVSLGVRSAVLTGVTGRRTDHTLWNLSLLRAFGDRMRLQITDDHCHIHRLDGVARFRAEVGQRLSLSPLDGAARDLWTEGLRWRLAGEALVPGERDGISNEVVSSPVSVRVGEGELLLIVQRGSCGGNVEFLDDPGNR